MTHPALDPRDADPDGIPNAAGRAEEPRTERSESLSAEPSPAPSGFDYGSDGAWV